MSNFFIELNSKIYTGFGTYITIITGIMGIYMFMFSEEEILKHQKFMMQYLNSLTQIPIKNLGQKIANTTLNIIEYIFGTTKYYSISAKSMWNIKIILFYSTVILLIFYWIIYNI